MLLREWHKSILTINQTPLYFIDHMNHMNHMNPMNHMNHMHTYTTVNPAMIASQGVNTMIASPSGAFAGVGFAIPSDTVNRIVTSPGCREIHELS